MKELKGSNQFVMFGLVRRLTVSLTVVASRKKERAIGSKTPRHGGHEPPNQSAILWTTAKRTLDEGRKSRWHSLLRRPLAPSE
jgi:hypothetical protein